MTEHFQSRQILTAMGLNALLDAIDALAQLGAMSYQGMWNASTNTPALASGVGVKGFYYTVQVAGTTAIDGISSWRAKDKIVFNGTAWEKLDGGDNEVLSVAGLYGSISAAALKAALTFSADDISDASANGRSLIKAADYAAMRSMLGVLALAGGTMTGALTLSGDGTNPLHAVTKQQLDAALYLMDGKQSCVVATTANITLSGTQTIDTVAVTVGQRVLVRAQTNTYENGIWIVAAGAWTRALDMDAWTEVPGAFVAIEPGGPTFEKTTWLCTAASTGTLGTTAITWVQTSSPTAGVSSFNSRNGAVSPANDDYAATMLQAIAANSILGNNTGSSARPIVLTAAQVRTLLGLGSAALLDVGVAANKVVQFDGSGKYPAADGSQITGLAALTEINRTTVSSAVATIEFSGTWAYKQLRLVGIGLSGSTSGRINIEVSDNNGTTWYGIGTGSVIRGFSSTFAASSLSSSADVSAGDAVAADTTELAVNINDCATASVPKHLDGIVQNSQGSLSVFAGRTASINAINRIRVKFASGNVDAGTLILLGA